MLVQDEHKKLAFFNKLNIKIASTEIRHSKSVKIPIKISTRKMPYSLTKIILGVMVLSVVATIFNVNAIAWWEENTWNGKRELVEMRSQTMVSIAF